MTDQIKIIKFQVYKNEKFLFRVGLYKLSRLEVAKSTSSDETIK